MWQNLTDDIAEMFSIMSVPVVNKDFGMREIGGVGDDAASSKREYRTTPNGRLASRESNARYKGTGKGRAAASAAVQKYRQSEKGRAMRRLQRQRRREQLRQRREVAS